MYNHRSQNFQNPKADALRKYIHQEACFIYKAPPINGFARRMNENSETIELPVTDSICPPDLLSSDRGLGQGCGTGLRDRDTGRETMMQIREPFKVAGHGPGSH